MTDTVRLWMQEKLDGVLAFDDLGQHAQLHASARKRALCNVDGFGRILQQVDHHLLDQDRVHPHHGKPRCHIVVEPHIASPQLDARQFDCLAHHGGHVGGRAVRLAALHEGADALDDLARALRLLGGFFERREQRLGVDRLPLDAGHHPIAVVGDGRQRLVELVRHAGGHFAHRDQAARGLGAVGLRGGLLFGVAPRRDVRGNHELG